MKYKMDKRQARRVLSKVLPGRELEAMEAMTCAWHGIKFMFVINAITYSLIWNGTTNKFEVRDHNGAKDKMSPHQYRNNYMDNSGGNQAY